MTYWLFLDDEREPPAPKERWIVFRNAVDAARYMEQHGCPEHISFDHDLGDETFTGAWLAKWMTDRWTTGGRRHLNMPENFTYTVHSQNPVGAENIKGHIEGFYDALERDLAKRPAIQHGSP